MKRMGYLYEKAFSKENISKAIDEASRNKKRRRLVKKILANKEKYVDDIYEMMDKRTYIPSEYMKGMVCDGIKKKTRVISKPRFYPDQVIHWCIYLVIRDNIYKSLIKTTCASIKGRGQVYGIKFIKKWLRNDKKNTKYYLKIDVHHYYPSVNNQILLNKLSRRIKDREFLALIKTILDLEPGLPIGMLLSQIFANLYLSELDHKYEKDKDVAHYMRYNDDIVVFSNSKRKLHKIRKKLVDDLSAYDLTMKANWQVCKTEKEMLDYMGFRIDYNKIIIRKKIMYRITRRARKFKIHPTFHMACSVNSDMGWIKHTQSWGLYQKHIRPFVDFKKAKEIVRKGDPRYA